MRPRVMVFVAVSLLLFAVPLANAQLAINVPVPTTDAAQPGSVLLAPPPAAGSSPGQAAGVPADSSTVVMYNNGQQERVRTFADYGPVRAFDSRQGLLSMQDGTEVTFPSNFAFANTPEPGQPVTIYYFIDGNGNHVLSAIDMGLQGGDTGGG